MLGKDAFFGAMKRGAFQKGFAACYRVQEIESKLVMKSCDACVE